MPLTLDHDASLPGRTIEMKLLRIVLLAVGLILAGCGTRFGEPGYYLSEATWNFTRGNNENAAWYVGRASSATMGMEAVYEYFANQPDLVQRYLDGAQSAAGKTDLQETIQESVVVLGVLSKLPGAPSGRIEAVMRACSEGLVRLDRAPQARREQAAREEANRRELASRVVLARSAAKIPCSTREQCERAFGMAEVFVSQNADMKIQVATTSVIETYNASEKGKVALKVLRVPRPEGDSEISLLATCRTDGDVGWQDVCDPRLLRIYTDFKDALLPFANRP